MRHVDKPVNKPVKKPRQVSAVSAADIIPDEELLQDDAFRDDLYGDLDDEGRLKPVDSPLSEGDESTAKGKKKRKKKRKKSRDERASEAQSPESTDADEPRKNRSRKDRPSKEKGRQGRSRDDRTTGKGRHRESGPREAGSSQAAPQPAAPQPATPRLEDVLDVALPDPAADVVLVAKGNAAVERKIALFIDFENLAQGVRSSPDFQDFDIGLFLERLLGKGKLVVKRAYADWERFGDLKRSLHEAAIELIDIPQKFYAGKTSSDIKLVVDALDLCYSKRHLDTFVLVSGDGNFSPLVSKLKENDKYVIGLGIKSASSSLLIDNCDEFIYYEDVWRDARQAPRVDHLPENQAECFQLLVESMAALLREDREVLWGRLLKQTMKRKKPSFNEGAYGFGSFTELLLEAERRQLIHLRKDRRSGQYVIVGLASDPA